MLLEIDRKKIVDFKFEICNVSFSLHKKFEIYIYESEREKKANRNNMSLIFHCFQPVSSLEEKNLWSCFLGGGAFFFFFFFFLEIYKNSFKMSWYATSSNEKWTGNVYPFVEQNLFFVSECLQLTIIWYMPYLIMLIMWPVNLHVQ